jgi:RNA polymerase sigma-70 factor, ECF subfamily
MTRQEPDRDPIASDAALLKAIANGRHAALRDRMARLTPPLLRLASSILPSPAEAEDVLQEAYLRLWRAAPEWRPGARVSTWLHTVVYRLSLDRLRRARNLPLEQGDRWLDAPDERATPEEALARRDQARLLEDMIATLPPRQRAAISLCYAQELSQAEAAAVLECTQEAYEALLGRARRKLRELLSEQT